MSNNFFYTYQFIKFVELYYFNIIFIFPEVFSSMAKKLIIEYEYDFDLYGIISTAKAYKLAWLINTQLDIHLVKDEDIHFSFLNEEKLVISNYLFETEHSNFRLLKNRSEENVIDKLGYLLPELNKFDYFIMKKGIINDYNNSELLDHLQKIREIQYIVTLDIDKIKSRENLIF